MKFYCPIGQELLNFVTNCCKLLKVNPCLPGPRTGSFFYCFRKLSPHLKHGEGYVRTRQLRRLVGFLLAAFTTLLELFLAVAQHMWVFCDN